jgi:phosphoglycolate phosphatase
LTDDLNRMFRHFIEHYSAHIADRSQAFPGGDAALDKLVRLPLCGLHNKLSLSRQLLAALGLTRRFEAICGHDTFE